MADSSIFTALLDRGLSPVHAAALVGNMQQESGLNPRAVNPDEGANGLLQWRESRWQGLQDFAKARGASPTDRDTQLDYLLAEGQGPERKSWSRFMAATDLPSANDALKGYIRYGDASGPQRLAYASNVLGGQGAPAAAPASPTAPPATPSTPMAGAAPVPPAASPEAPSAPLSLSPQMASAPAQQQPVSLDGADASSISMPLTNLAKARLFAALLKH